MSSTLVILTYNEIEGITALFDRIPFDAVDEFFVVDGGSTDGTIQFCRERGVRVVPQEIHGRGEAFRIGAREAKGENLVFFGPDGNEDPADIPRLVKLLEDGHDMVIASRFMEDSRNDEDDKLLRFRAWANQAFTSIANFIWKGNITDTINGFRAIKKPAIENLRIDAQGFVIEYQMSIRAMKLGLKVAEIPTIEGDRIGGESTARSIPTGLKMLRCLLGEIWVGKRFAGHQFSA